ncbi:MAG: DEAD/DEAH box helicase [Deltaproteobacteria bacterium]|nr:DEAD/DEAH box helicase [Deltaproteobacteria bacterium]
MSTAAFSRLSPALQYQIINTLGWPALRPVQEAAIGPVLDGKNCVVLAPTAGGKTEAAFFPLLAAMDERGWRPVSVVYLSPIRALLNNQEERVSYYAGLVGRRAFKWHGDVGQSERRRFLREPADILLTTPESIEAMFMSTRVPARALFAGLQAVVIDEIHAFAADDRGAHLSALLERLSRCCGRDPQRVGLSATVGNPGAILEWVRGSSRREGLVVDPAGERAVADLTVDHVGSVENAARVIQALHPGRKRLVFVDARRHAETLGVELNQRGVETFVIHGSLSVRERREAEHAFHDGQDCVIVATSALELGIDVGDLDQVLQLDAPGSVASFLQRMGRTGRRPGARPNCTFLATKDETVLQAAALVALYRRGYVEPVRPSGRAAHILAHQILGLAVAQGGVPRGDLWAWLEGAAAFSGLEATEREGVLEHMLSNGILSDQGGRLWLGEAGEKLYGRAGFRRLYAVFEAPRLIAVRWNASEIGEVDAAFLSVIHTEEEPGCFTLAGRFWQVEHVDWERGSCIVRPAPGGRAPRWSGGGRFLGYELCQAMREVLVGAELDPSWSARARQALATLRADRAFLREARAPLVETGDELVWWTFGGGAANLLLARMLEAALGGRVTSRNTAISLRGQAGKSLVAVRQTLRAWRETGRPSPADALGLADAAARARLSKFEPCLPPGLLSELRATRLLDPEAAASVVAAGGNVGVG